MKILNDLYTENGHRPNFTIITPGPCNAKCDFCFWDKKDGKIKPPADYIDSLVESFKAVPYSIAPALSISGGEPTISPYFEKILYAINSTPRKWDRVILTTNGTNLDKWLDTPIMQKVVTNINISRHADQDDDNRNIFESNVVPSAQEIVNMVKVFGKKYAFNINCMINDDTEESFIYRMLVHVFYELNIESISFRKEAGNVNPTKVEESFIKKFGVDSTNKCPVCRTAIQTNKGMRIMWKGSHPQPSQHLGKLYELIFHPNGKVYADWDRKLPVDLNMEPSTPDGKYWCDKWMHLVREFEAYKKNSIDIKFVGPAKQKKLTRKQNGCHAGGDDEDIWEFDTPKKSKIDEINEKYTSCHNSYGGHCSNIHNNSHCGNSRVSNSCGGGGPTRGCGGGCGG